MNKTGLVKAVAQKTDSTEKIAKKYVDAVLDCILQGLKDDRKVSIQGFGSFEAVEQPKGKTKLSKPGDKLYATAHRASFKPGKAMKESVNIKLIRIEPRK